MLKVHAKKLDAVEVLCLEGQIISGDTDVLNSALWLAPGTNDIVLDLSNVTVVDAHGLGVLLELREQILARGIHFKLMNLSKRLYGIFEITRLDTVFEIGANAYAPQIPYPQQVLAAA